jgi:rubrerythrin
MFLLNRSKYHADLAIRANLLSIGLMAEPLKKGREEGTMKTKNFNVDRALQVAIEMEEMGKTFYESLAMGCCDSRIAALAVEMAKAETSHIEIFKRMLSELSSAKRGPQLTSIELYEAARELLVGIMPEPSTVRNTVLTSDIKKALDMAIDMESASVTYYTQLSFNTKPEDAKIMTRIIEEENKHLEALRQRRADKETH